MKEGFCSQAWSFLCTCLCSLILACISYGINSYYNLTGLVQEQAMLATWPSPFLHCITSYIPCCTLSVLMQCLMHCLALTAWFEKHRVWLLKAITLYSTFPVRTDGSATDILSHLQIRNISLDISSWIPRKWGTQHYHLPNPGLNHLLVLITWSVCQTLRILFTRQALNCLTTWILCPCYCSHDTSPQRSLWAVNY